MNFLRTADDLFALLAAVGPLTHDIFALGALVQVDDVALSARLTRAQRERLLLLQGGIRIKQLATRHWYLASRHIK